MKMSDEFKSEFTELDLVARQLNQNERDAIVYAVKSHDNLQQQLADEKAKLAEVSKFVSKLNKTAKQFNKKRIQAATTGLSSEQHNILYDLKIKMIEDIDKLDASFEKESE